MEDRKWCSLGRHYADRSEFGYHSSKADGLQTSCKLHMNERSRNYHYEVRREQRTGMSHAEYDKKYKEQKGLCATCKTFHEVLEADHDHSNGKPRGLLCTDCNKAIGLIHDKPSVARRIAKYLTERV